MRRLDAPQGAVAPLPMVPAAAAPAAVEPALPFVSWPEAPDPNPTLTWPPGGCDAGMWSVRYHIERARSRARVSPDPRPTFPGAPPGDFVLEHPGGWELDLYPTTPKSGWVLTRDPGHAVFDVQRLEDGAATCSVEVARDEKGPWEARALPTKDGLMVFSRTAGVWAADAFDHDCRRVGSRELPAMLAEPPAAVIQTAPDVRPVMNAVFDLEAQAVGDTIEVRKLGTTGFVAQTERPLMSYTMRRWGDVATLAFWDEGTTHVFVLDAETLATRWSTTLENNQPWQDPITHIGYADGYLSLQGGLDAVAWNAGNEWIRMFDTRTGMQVAASAVDRSVDLPLSDSER